MKETEKEKTTQTSQTAHTPTTDAKSESRGPGKNKDATPNDASAARAKLNELVQRASAGDRAALEELRQFMDVRPGIHKRMGDLVRHVEGLWLDALAEGSVLGRESIERYLADLKRELGGPHPVGLEKLLVDQIGINFLAHRRAELIEASNDNGDKVSLAVALLHARRVEIMHKRYLSSIKTLALVRTQMSRGLVPPSLTEWLPEKCSAGPAT